MGGLVSLLRQDSGTKGYPSRLVCTAGIAVGIFMGLFENVFVDVWKLPTFTK